MSSLTLWLKILGELRDIGVIRANLPNGFDTDMKHIPDLYKHNSREVRLGLLAGLINSDGSYNEVQHCFRFGQSVRCHTRLFNDFVWLAKCLGFYCSVPTRRWMVSSNGLNVERWDVVLYGDLADVPCLLPRKQAREREIVRTARGVGIRHYTVERPGPIIDIQTNGDNLFLRGDFLVLRGAENAPVPEVAQAATETVAGSSQDKDDLSLEYICSLQAEEYAQLERDASKEKVAGPSRSRQELGEPPRPSQRPVVATQERDDSQTLGLSTRKGAKTEEAVSSRTRSKGKKEHQDNDQENSCKSYCHLYDMSVAYRI